MPFLRYVVPKVIRKKKMDNFQSLALGQRKGQKYCNVFPIYQFFLYGSRPQTKIALS